LWLPVIADVVVIPAVVLGLEFSMAGRHTPQSQPATAKLAAQVAHELNNPLDAVLRLVSLAQRKSQAGQYADVDRHLADAQFGLQRMAEVLRQVMELGRQTHDALAGTHREVQVLAAILEQVVHTVGPLAEQKHVVVEVENRLPAGVVPQFDSRLMQVLSNLVKNAVEAAPEHSAVRVRVCLKCHCTLEIAVEDSGAGIGADLLPRLFTPFVTTKGSGHGLGLVISRDLVTALHGTLQLENRASPEHGCVATVKLPLPS
jgi:signal transduction histidine kinase